MNELKSLPSLDQKDGDGGGIVSYVSIMRLNFALDAASASIVSQLRRGLSLVGGAVNHPPATNKLDCLPCLVLSTHFYFLIYLFFNVPS